MSNVASSNLEAEHMVDDEFDELDDFISARSQESPAFAAAFLDARTRSRLISDLVGIRKALDVNQIVVAERMGTSQSAVSDFEKGKGDFRFSTAQRYARAVTACIGIVVEMPCDGPWSASVRSRRYLAGDQAYNTSADRVENNRTPSGSERWIRGKVAA